MADVIPPLEVMIQKAVEDSYSWGFYTVEELNRVLATVFNSDEVTKET